MSIGRNQRHHYNGHNTYRGEAIFAATCTTLSYKPLRRQAATITGILALHQTTTMTTTTVPHKLLSLESTFAAKTIGTECEFLKEAPITDRIKPHH